MSLISCVHHDVAQTPIEPPYNTTISQCYSVKCPCNPYITVVHDPIPRITEPLSIHPFPQASNMVLTLISATPSPFARINRIALIEKGIPFELKNEVPWDSTTETPKYNPLEKLPILILDDGSVIYDSAFIQEYIVQKFTQGDSLLPDDIDGGLQARQIQVLSEGIMDSIALIFAEKNRAEGMTSEVWFARQERKINGALRALSDMVKSTQGGFLVAKKYTIADIAAGSAIGMVEMMGAQGFLKPWRSEYPELEKYWLMLEERESFKQTKPYMFEVKDFKL